MRHSLDGMKRHLVFPIHFDSRALSLEDEGDYAAQFIEGGWVFFDRECYPDCEISDEEFASLYNSRKSDEVVESKPSADVRFVGYLMNNGRYVSGRRAADGTAWTLDW
ncbi:hypothetical protein ACVWY5_002322 [Bradyrhizobium sp. USDA 3256]